MTVKGLIFDLDGVIVFTDQYHYKAWKQMADEKGIYFDQEINNRLRGVSRMESLEIILERYEGEPLSDEDKQKMAEEKKAAAKKDKEEKSEKLKDKKTEDSTKSDSVTVTASSVEELLKKINDIYYETLSDNVMTEDEKRVGQHFDMNV